MKLCLSLLTALLTMHLGAADLHLEVSLPFENQCVSLPWKAGDLSTHLPELGITLTGKIIPEKNGLTGTVTVADTTGKDRCVKMKLAVLLPGSTWRWHYDPEASAICETQKRYFEIDYTPLHRVPAGRFVSYDPEFKIDSFGLDGHRTVSIYPYSCVEETIRQESYSLGFPLSEPRVCQLGFVRRADGKGELSLTVDLGLSPDTLRFPSRGSFSFFLEQLSPGSGFREAVAAYYRRYPEYIRRRTDHTGIWTLWMPDRVFAPWDFGIGWNQVDTGTPEYYPDGKAMRWQQPTFLYTEPWGYYQLFPSRKGYKSHPVTTEQMKRELEESRQADPAAPDFYVGHVRRRTIAEAVAESACEVDPQGSWQSNWWSAFGMRGVTDAAWIQKHFGSLHYSMILCNPDPKLPLPNRGAQSLDMELAELNRKEFAGVQLDSFSAFAGMLHGDFKRSHWKSATIPLVISYRYRRPAQLHYFSAFEYLLELRRRYPDKWIGINSWLPWTTFLSPYVDAIGAGENSILGNENRWFLNLRALAPAKMISVLDYTILTAPETGKAYEARIRPRFEAGLLYAVFPGTGDAWQKPEKVERARVLYREYIPLYQALAYFPWNPVTGVKRDNNRVQLERFGNLLCVYNPGGQAETVRLKALDPGNKRVWDLRTLEEISAPGGVWTRKIPPQYCRIYLIGNAGEWEETLERWRKRCRDAIRQLENCYGTPEQIAEARAAYQAELLRLTPREQQKSASDGK